MNSPHNPLDPWEWIYAFFRATIELDGKMCTEAANYVTGEDRPVPDDDEIANKLKPLMGEVHDQVCDCSYAEERRSEQERTE